MNYPKSKVIEVKEVPANTVVFNKTDLLDEVNYGSYNDYFVRSSGEFDGKAVFLNNCYDWQIVTDSLGVLCAVPTKKK